MEYDYAVSETPIEFASSQSAPSFPSEGEKLPEIPKPHFSEGSSEPR